MANPPENARLAVLNLLRGERGKSFPSFSPLSTIIAPALAARGLKFQEIHHDPQKMVIAAASAHELYGWQSATLPTDLIAEAEALGAEIDFRQDMPEPMWSLATRPPFAAPQDVVIPRVDFAQRGRIPLIVDAIKQLKQRVGNQIVVGAWIAGPFTLGMSAVDFDTLLLDVKRAPREVSRALDQFTDVLSDTANAYHNAGADFITIHEMGGSPGVLGPNAFGTLLLPALQRLIKNIPSPTILSVCGNTNNAMELIAQAGATAIHVDQLNNLAHSRQVLGRDVLLFGNIDPVGVIADGDDGKIRAAVERAAHDGADAVTPGCDLYFQTPVKNLRTLTQAINTQRRI